jgi:hypothetical protein
VQPTNPAFPARWAYSLYALSLGTGIVAPIIRESVFFRELDLSTGRSGPHDFTVRTDTFVGTLEKVLRAHTATAARPACRDDRDTSLVWRKSARMSERAALTNRPSLDLSPLRPKGDRACLRARDSSGVFLNPNSCRGFEPEPSKEGSG